MIQVCYIFLLSKGGSLKITRPIWPLIVVELATWHIVILKFTVNSLGGMLLPPLTYW